jgi:hypothetical protein
MGTVAKPKRRCPALGETIPSSRCGEERGLRIACTDDCEFNPFARRNYDQLRELEDAVVTKSMLRYRQEAGLPAFERMLAAARYDASDELVSHGRIARALYQRPLPDGRRLADCWEAARWQGLNNDERRLFQALAGQRLAVLEVHRQIDEQTVEVIDLLDADPVPFMVVDRAVTRTWLRFETLLTWAYEVPHFHRLHGVAMRFEGVGNADPEETLAAIVPHLGGPAVLSEARAWMAEHFEEILDSLEASRVALREAALKGVDASHGVALYRWTKGGKPALLNAKFRKAPGFEGGDLEEDAADEGWTEAWDVLEQVDAESAQMELPLEKRLTARLGDPLIGSVAVGPQGVRVSAQGRRRYAALKHQVERLGQGMIVFESERIDDLARQLLERERLSYDQALVPPSLLEKASTLELASFRAPVEEDDEEDLVRQSLLRQYKGYADRPIPLLDDRTPRQAATDPLLRPRLIRLIKRNLHDLDLKLAKEGGFFDLSGLLEELGLHEINFPPPPEREQEPEGLDEFEDDGMYQDLDDDGYFLPEDWIHDPTVIEMTAPGRELGEKEVMARLELLAGVEGDKGPESLIRASREWVELSELTEPLEAEWSEMEIGMLRLQLLQVAFVMHPEKPADLRVRPGRVFHYSELERDRGMRMLENDPKATLEEVFFSDSPQRVVVESTVGYVLDQPHGEGGSKAGRGKKPLLRTPVMLDMVCIIRAFIRELSHWPVR